MILDSLTLALKNKFDTDERNGVHVSDLTLCPRKAIFRKLEPYPLTMRDLNFFTSGRAIHDAIQILAQENPSFEIEKEVKHGNVVGHIDLYDSEHNTPIECKSMRTKEVKEPKSHHVEQLKTYMAICKSNKGILLYQCLLHFDEKPFVEFEINMTNEEIDQRLKQLDEEAASYEKNLEQKTPLEAINVFENPKLNWLCVNRDGKPNCPYYDRCKTAKK